MKKNVLFTAFLGLLILLNSCDTPNNNKPQQDADDTPDVTTINGVYEYKEVINGHLYTATITISDYDDYLLIYNPDYSGQHYPGDGYMSTVESPRTYGAMGYTDSEIEARIREAYAVESKNPRTRYDVSSFEAFRRQLLKEVKGADGTKYAFSIYTTFSYGTEHYDENQIVQLAGFDISDAFHLVVGKGMYGESLFFMKKNDFSRLFCFTPSEQLRMFKKIK